MGQEETFHTVKGMQRKARKSNIRDSGKRKGVQKRFKGPKEI